MLQWNSEKPLQITILKILFEEKWSKLREHTCHKYLRLKSSVKSVCDLSKAEEVDGEIDIKKIKGVANPISPKVLL